MAKPVQMSEDTYRRALGDGLTLRWSTAQDVEQVASMKLIPVPAPSWVCRDTARGSSTRGRSATKRV